MAATKKPEDAKLTPAAKRGQHVIYQWGETRDVLAIVTDPATGALLVLPAGEPPFAVTAEYDADGAPGTWRAE